MKGDNFTIHHEARKTSMIIVEHILNSILVFPRRLVLSIGGESGSGKTALANAIVDEFANKGIIAVIFGLDDYFVLPPKTNDSRRRQDPDWLGPHVEVKLDVFDQNLKDAINGKNEVTKPLIDYDLNRIEEETISLNEIKVIIAEGTYTSLLKHVHVRIFIDKDWRDTFENRMIRSRGNEAGDPQIEGFLSTEHKIIAGHRQLADFIITKDNQVIKVE